MNKENQQELELIDFLKPRYNILEKIGEGTFSFVFKAEDMAECSYEKNIYVIKVITRTTAPNRIIDELKFLKELEGRSNIIPLVGVHRYEDQVCAIFPFFQSKDYKTFLREAKLEEIRNYLYNLLIALKNCHSQKIIHRDIKPNNFLYNPKLRRGVLIDFGLAQREKEERKKEVILSEKPNITMPSLLFFNSTLNKIPPPPGYYVEDTRAPMKAHRAGTRGYRAPEVLFRSSRQTCKIDIWSVGVIFLSLCTKQYPFFNSVDDVDGLAEIATIFGHEEMRKVAKYYERTWRSNLISIPQEGIRLEKIVNSLNPELNFPDEGFDLMYRLLNLNGDDRISAEEALMHPFFKNEK